MIFTERTITVRNRNCSIDNPIVLYRGDKNIELRISINDNLFISDTTINYGQLIMQLPNTNITIFSTINEFRNDIVKFMIPEDMMNDITEVGLYNIQLRIFDENKTSAVTLPEIKKALDVREPIAIEGQENKPTITYDAVTMSINIDDSYVTYTENTKSISINNNYVSYNDTNKTILI